MITQDKRLIIGKKHTTLSGNSDVLAAGNINFKKGKIKLITNESGHYRPTVQEGLTFPERLQELGFDTSGSLFKLYEFEIDANGMIIGVPNQVVNTRLP